MPVRIKQLNCKVIVATGGKHELLHQEARPSRPSMEFALPTPHLVAEGGQPSGDTATGERAHSVSAPHDEATAPQANARKVEAQAVADRVYELMKQEIALTRMRSGRG